MADWQIKVYGSLGGRALKLADVEIANEPAPWNALDRLRDGWKETIDWPSVYRVEIRRLRS